MSAAFDVVFGVFVAAILTLGVVAIRWALRRDRVARARQADRPRASDPAGLPGPGTAAGPPGTTVSRGPSAEKGAS